MDTVTHERPLDIVVRFSTSTPDIVLHVDTPSSLSIVALKQRIRAELQLPTSTSRLRLIHSGKVLADAAALSKSVSVTLPPPSSNDSSKSEKAKGKQPVRDRALSVARVYIHCAIGDVLTPAELVAEGKAASEADSALRSASTTSSIIVDGHSPSKDASTTPAPRGFDRLLSAGFTAAEVAALRTQFLAIQAHTHTPDTMPSGPDLLALEERWLDNGSNPASAGDDGDAGGLGADDAGSLEDMLYGNLMGFFWPVGAMCWLMREEGVWSRRRQIAVLFGFLVNLSFGFLRVMN